MNRRQNLKRVRSETLSHQRRLLYRRAVFIAIGGNVLLFVAKGLVAWISGSSAVFSDAANSLSDVFYSVIMGGGLYLSQRPADETHPQGHSRFEPLVSLLIVTAMGIAGVTAAWQSVQRFLAGGEAIRSGWPTVVLVGSILVKFGMYRLVKQVGEKSGSPAILASARDNLADVLTSAAALGGVWGSQLIHPLSDPVAGFVVALWIFRATGEILLENIGYLTGRGVPAELNERIAETAVQVSGVEDVHQVIVEYVGPYLRVDLHIDVPGQLTLTEAHAIAESVRDAIKTLPRVDLVYIHPEPAEREN